MGKADVEWHINTPMHVSYVNATKSGSTIKHIQGNRLNMYLHTCTCRPYSTANMNILVCDMLVTYIGKASSLMRYTSMVELSDLFKQLDTVGKLRYKEKHGMLGVTTDPYCAYVNLRLRAIGHEDLLVLSAKVHLPVDLGALYTNSVRQ